MSPTRPNHAETGRRRQSRRTGWIIVLLLCSLMLLVYFQFTAVSGLEVHPESWQIRQFSFRREPFTNYQFTGIKHSAPMSLAAWTPLSKSAQLDAAVSTHLRTAAQPNGNWDLVEVHNSKTRGDAWLLVELLSATDANLNPFWPNWSKQHTSKAALLWPAAQDLTRLGLYSHLPRLLELGLCELSPSEFKRRIAEHVQLSVSIPGNPQP